MEKKTYLNTMQIAFESNYTIKSRRLKETEAKQEKEKKRNILQVH